MSTEGATGGDDTPLRRLDGEDGTLFVHDGGSVRGTTVVTVERDDRGRPDRVACFGDRPADALPAAGLEPAALREATVEVVPVTRGGLRRFDSHGDLLRDADESLADYVDELVVADGWPPPEKAAAGTGFDSDDVRAVEAGDDVGLGEVVAPASSGALGVHFDVGEAAPLLWFDRGSAQADAVRRLDRTDLDRPTAARDVLGVGTGLDRDLLGDAATVDAPPAEVRRFRADDAGDRVAVVRRADDEVDTVAHVRHAADGTVERSVVVGPALGTAAAAVGVGRAATDAGDGPTVDYWHPGDPAALDVERASAAAARADTLVRPRAVADGSGAADRLLDALDGDAADLAAELGFAAADVERVERGETVGGARVTSDGDGLSFDLPLGDEVVSYVAEGARPTVDRLHDRDDVAVAAAFGPGSERSAERENGTGSETEGDGEGRGV